MTFGFLQSAMLLGLASLAIPVIIHFWNRRRPDVVDWGAMQFLELHPARKRRLILDELLLLAARLALLALLVGGLATPFVRGPLAAAWLDPPRDVVYVLDASASMARTDVSPSAWKLALETLDVEIRSLRPGDRWGVVLANRPVRVFGTDLYRPAEREALLANLPSPAGEGDGPTAVTRAEKLLAERGRAGAGSIVIITDGQRWGWTDPASMLKWDQHARVESGETTRPRVRAVVVPRTAVEHVANYAVTSLDTSRRVAVVGQRVRFTATVESDRPGPAPRQVRALAEEDVLRRWEGAEFWDAKAGRGQVRFEHSFPQAGPQVIRVFLDPSEREGQVMDPYPADNQREMVVEVVPDFPVLIVDGAESSSPASPAYFLVSAFADPADKLRPSPVTARRVPASRFTSESLLENRPRVLVFADVAELSEIQAAAVEQYLARGGSVLVLLGPRVLREAYNERLFRGGKGWLPCRLEGSESLPDGGAATLDSARLLHPALTLFETRGKSQLAELTFRRWWRVTTERNAAAISAIFSTGDPWLVEKSVGLGRVLVSTVPFDRSWENGLASAWEFPVLAHELVYALADVGGRRFNPAPGEPIRIGPDAFVPPWTPSSLPLAGVLHAAEGKTRPLLVANWPGMLDAPGPAGLYRIKLDEAPVFPIVVQDDPQEADATPMSAEERRRLTDTAGIIWDAVHEDTETGDSEVDLWRGFFLAVLAFVCLEAWLASRMS